MVTYLTHLIHHLLVLILVDFQFQVLVVVKIMNKTQIAKIPTKMAKMAVSMPQNQIQDKSKTTIQAVQPQSLAAIQGILKNKSPMPQLEMAQLTLAQAQLTAKIWQI